jgi:glycosyltransferase involved in cell wall biosynthesis
VAGDAALYFSPMQPPSIAEAIGRVLADETLRAELSQRSLKQAGQFSWAQTAAATLQIYRQVDKSYD